MGTKAVQIVTTARRLYLTMRIPVPKEPAPDTGEPGLFDELFEETF